MEAGVLKTLRDLDEAPIGLYVVRSKTPAYFPAMGLIEEGLAEFKGEFYDEHGFHIVTLKIKAPSEYQDTLQGPEDERRTITIGREFFVTALKDYKDWEIKWWREAVQNGVDAGGATIHLGVGEHANGNLIYCDDDGSGMDEDTMLNKFLVLGASTKVGAKGVAGGFGKAKELLLLPWVSWSIHSRDTLVEGAGIDYTVKKTKYRQGTRLEVVMPKDKTTSSAMAINFLERCYLPDVRFTVDDKSVRAKLHADNIVVSDPGKADIYFVPTKGNTQSYAYVRTKGLYMFSIYVGSVPGYVLVELTAPSIEILTANRDGFRDWSVGNTVDKLAEKIAKDNMSALNSKRGMIRKKYEGSGKFRAKQLAAALLEQIGPTSGKKLSSTDEEGILETVNQARQFEEERGQSNDLTELPPPSMAAAMLDQKFLGPDHLQNAIRQLVWEPDFFLINEIDGFKVPRKFFPETMTPRVMKLAKSWTELCRYVLMQLGSDERYGVGFIFSTSMAAAALTESESGSEEKWLLINPFKDLYDRNEVWSPSQDSDLKWLYAAAIHECTHIANGIDYHDASFAAALTYNMAKCADGYRKIKQIVGAIRGRGGLEADEE